MNRLKQAIESNARTDRASIQLSNYYWRDCAARQQQQRVSAETEQKRLVAATNAQATYIDNLSRLFQRTGTEQQGRSIFDGEISDDTVFKALLQEVDDSYTHANKLFQECNMDELPIGITNSSHGRTSDGEVEYLQHVNKGMQPFDYYDTYKFSWKVAGHPHRQHDREVYEGAVGLRDTIAIKFRLERTLTTGSKVSVLQRLVNRRYFEQNQVIHVWKIYSEGEGFLRGMNSIETGWCRFRPTSDGFGTWTEVVVRQVPVFLNTVMRSGSIVGEFRQLLEDKVDEDEEALRSAVEGMLLEDTLAILDE
ncbi:hypothetical protein PHPALM_30703 [Phytophthora palmivora]|uniref:M96 mating-specific protein family n=1 Tax=Phytophthora palmivora TaxID=4796 RepID=A0A2P4X4H1_9STRA|nr:hypothetical protein PHPALM_30703 [Phytophthora palmivora]